MAAKVLHFGPDVCHRLPVLSRVGYDVEICPSLVEFPPLLQRAYPDAVLVTDRPNSEHRHSERHQVIAFTREHSQARLILFDSSYSVSDEEDFDLVIPPLIHPEEWLRQIAAVIERSRALNAASAATRKHSTLVVMDAQITRLKSIIARERSAATRAKAQRAIDQIGRRSDPSDK